MTPNIAFHESLAPSPAKVALVWAEGLAGARESDGLPEFLAPLVERAAALWPDGLKTRVRKMLRHGKYRANGRGKPASEFLLGAAVAGTFPAVNDLVDINNAVSLEFGYPCSVFDLDKTGPDLLLRHGLEGESYVFNTAGHAIELRDLLLVCRREGDDWLPSGNAVKDSMATKVGADTQRVVAVIYAPADEPDERIQQAATRFETLLKDVCNATTTGTVV